MPMRRRDVVRKMMVAFILVVLGLCIHGTVFIVLGGLLVEFIVKTAMGSILTEGMDATQNLFLAFIFIGGIQGITLTIVWYCINTISNALGWTEILKKKEG